MDPALADALMLLFPEGLTSEEERQRYAREEWRSLDGHFQRAGSNGIDRDALANEAVWLRIEGLSFAQIGERLGICAQTARDLRQGPRPLAVEHS